jgi:hypothetical protein
MASPPPASPPPATPASHTRPARRRAAPARPAAGPSALGALLAGLATAGAALLAAAEPLTLYTLHVSSARAPIGSSLVSAHDSYALVPVAVLAAALAWGVWRRGSRVGLAALAALGVTALLIALLGDLPDAHASGVVRLAGGHFALARATPGLGFYLETLGALVLLAVGVCGLLLTVAD